MKKAAKKPVAGLPVRTPVKAGHQIDININP